MRLEDALNSDRTITIGGIVFDVPEKEGLQKWDFRSYKEGGSTIRELWLNTYERSVNSVSRMSYSLKVSSRGKCTLEDKPLKGEDAEKAKALIESL